MSRPVSIASLVLATFLFPTLCAAEVRITEFASEGMGDLLSGNGGRRQREFFELTNLDKNNSVDVSTWSYNDNNTNDPHNWGPAIGSLQPGESIIFTQMTADDFRSYWGLDNSVRIVSYLQLSNLGNADTINIYNSFSQSAATLVDSLTYTADARGSGISRNRPWDGGSGQYPNTAWVESSAGDVYQSYLAPSPTGFPPNFPDPRGPWNPADYIDVGNPGVYVPEPGGLVLASLGSVALLAVARRRRAK
jgi:hypothetical protein